LPGGYDPSLHYPTIYVTPNPYEAWINAVRLNSTVDQLEAAGDIPQMIYIFAPATGGPHAVTQCIDSADGLQHWDTFMSTTLIQYIDSHYGTIASAAGRTIMGSSQGAYCSADLLLRHPDVWNQEISFVGFYDAAPRNPRTASGGDVFGGDQALMDAYSPITIAPKIAPDVRKNLFFVLAGLSSQDFFGPEMDRFTGILDQNGYARAVIQTPFGHSWKTEETFLPRALSLIGQRLVKQGVLQ
jgi:S-formylglutathione hydrolase FrmB